MLRVLRRDRVVDPIYQDWVGTDVLELVSDGFEECEGRSHEYYGSRQVFSVRKGEIILVPIARNNQWIRVGDILPLEKCLEISVGGMRSIGIPFQS